MNGRPLTDARVSQALRAHLPQSAPAGLRELIVDAAETTTQQRALPSFLGALTEADPVARRRSLLIAAALLLAVAVTSAAAVGAWRLLQRDPVDELSLEPPADVPAFVLSSYERLLEQFWLNHDPTVKDRQFCDVGSQYRPSIFYHTEAQQQLAEASKARWDKDKPFKQRIVTPIVPAGDFWPAEEYHQDYYKKNPLRYKLYTSGCGRYARLDELWGKLRK